MTGLRYLESRTPTRGAQVLSDERYATLRDEFVLRFRYHTARAYAGDLDHLRDWAAAADLDVVGLTAREIERYVAALAEQQFSPNTLVRKRTALRGFYALATRVAARGASPMTGWPWRRRATTAAISH